MKLTQAQKEYIQTVAGKPVEKLDPRDVESFLKELEKWYGNND